MEFRFIDSRTLDPAAEALLGEFEEQIYLPAFPDEGEREPFDSIMARIRSGAEAYPQTFAVLAWHQGALAGGEIFDWYPDCGAAELIYIALLPGCRGARLGDELLREGVRQLSRSLAERGETMRRLFFETENPFLSETDDGMDKVSRVRFFARNSACRVPIRYYQPPLAPGAPWAENLYLCTLPEFSEGGAELPAGELKEFLRCFFRGLGASTDHPRFLEMLRSIDYVTESDGSVECHALAEQPQFLLTRFSLVYHFLLDGRRSGSDAEEDPLFNSYECDLMNYSLQEPGRRPVRTKHVRLYRKLILHLPRFYKYTSEGQDFHKVSEHTALPVTVSVNCSDSLNRNVSLAHLVITPDENSGVPFKGPWSVRILKEDGVLLLLEKGTICRRFEITLGKGFSVPSGDFKVGAKLGYPNYELNGTLYKLGAVGNTLGSRWIELKNAEGVPVSGICGESMIKPERAEKPLFFQLKNADINEIFGLLAEGSEVKVK